MAILSTLAQIEQVQTAITAVMANQSYRIGDITYERADLKALQERETTLLARYRREQGGGMVNRANMGSGI